MSKLRIWSFEELVGETGDSLRVSCKVVSGTHRKGSFACPMPCLGFLCVELDLSGRESSECCALSFHPACLGASRRSGSRMQTVCGGSSRHTSSPAVPWMNVFSPIPRRNRSCPEFHSPAGRRAGCLVPGWLCPGVALQSQWLPFQLAQDDAWKCPHCQVLQQGVVKLSLWTLPDILIIHLKRFCQVGERRNKLSTLVKFPLSGLNMAPHVARRSTNSKAGPGPWSSWKQPICLPTTYPMDFLYDLYAVCNHHGSLQGGHYTGEPCHASLRASAMAT